KTSLATGMGESYHDPYIRILIYNPGCQSPPDPHSSRPARNSMSSTIPAAQTIRLETFDADLALTFTDRGTGPGVLVLHGGAGPISVARFAETMSATHRVIAPTQPG